MTEFVTSRDNTPGKVCQICGRVLNAVAPRDDPLAVSWVHAFKADHEAVPVDADTVTPVYVCDFCTGTEAPVRTLRASSFEVLIPDSKDTNISVTDWGACQVCADLIDANDWRGLAKRAADTYIEAKGYTPGLRAFIRAQYAELRKHAITGKTEPDPAGRV